jgi:hypothetical protein
VALFRRRDQFDALIGRRIVVHLQEDDRSVRGVLKQNFVDSVSLGNPEYLAEAKADDIQGEVGILKSNVSFWQVL